MCFSCRQSLHSLLDSDNKPDCGVARLAVLEFRRSVPDGFLRLGVERRKSQFLNCGSGYLNQRIIGNELIVGWVRSPVGITY